MISKKTVDEILLVAKIEEVVGDFVSLKKRGQNWVGVCPFHDDKNPSMYVSPRLGIFKCFVCDAGGNAVHFLMEHEKISYPEALLYLAKKYNIPVEEEAEKSPEEKAAQNERDSMFIVNSYAETYFISQLFDTEEGRTVALSYFKERGFNESTIRKFRLGYNPEGWDAFTKEALQKGYNKRILLKTGLIKETDTGKLYDFYRGRIIFPIHNTLGKVVGFGGRILGKSDKIAKYFNSPESEIYHKSDILYGFYFAKKSIRTLDNVYLVEGYTDVISLVQSGIENVVASSGTALTERQIKLLSSQTQNITVLYDGDTAGIKASLRSIDLLLSAGMNVKVVLLPEGEDPDSFARHRRDSDLKEYLEKNATDFLLFKVKVMSKEAGKDPMKRASMVNEMIDTIAGVRDPVARAFYIKECAEIFDLSEEVLNVQLRKTVWKKMNETKGKGTPDLPPVAPLVSGEKVTAKEKPLSLIEKNIILLILQYGMYEINVEKPHVNGKAVYETVRIDQYIFDEFHEEEIRFSVALHQAIYDEYAVFAPKALSQDEIKKHFSLHENKDIQDFAMKHLIDSNPDYSIQWETRFDMPTNTLTNSLQKLNNEVESHINMFKLRLLEQYRQILLQELNADHPPEIEEQVTRRLMAVLTRRKELAELLGTVVTNW